MGEEISIMDELESALIENSRLRSLLSDAMKALEPMAKQMEAEHFGRGGPVVPKGWEDRFLAAADVWARIKATLTGGE